MPNQTHQPAYLLWLLLIAAGLIFVGLGLRDPWPADEPRFAQVAQEMVATGQWFFPARGGELYPDKPPLFMWAIALFYLLTGSINIAFLLPSALSALATVALIYDLGRRLFSPRIGFYAGLLLIFSLQFTLQAKTAQIDAMVCFWITLGCYGMLRHLLLGPDWRWFYLSGLAMGLGVITKGVGFLPLLMLLPYTVLRWRYPQANEIRGGWRWLGVMASLLLAIGLWLVPMLYLVDQAQDPLFEQYRNNILFKQTAKRYANSWHHIKPFWYYLVAVIPLLWLPLSALLPWLLKHWRKAWQQQDRRILLPLFWVVLVILFFSLSPGKRGVYILPALPMLCLAAAPYLPALWQQRRCHHLLLAIVVLLGSIILFLGLGGYAGLQALMKLSARYNNIAPWGFFTTLGSLTLAGAIWAGRSGQGGRAWPVFILLLWGLYSTWGYQLLNPIRTPKAVLARVAQLADGPVKTLAVIPLKEQFLLFSPYPMVHFGYHTPVEQQQRRAWQWLAQGEGRYLLIDKATAASCFDLSQAPSAGIAHRMDWRLVSARLRRPDCPAPTETVRIWHRGVVSLHFRPQ